MIRFTILLQIIRQCSTAVWLRLFTDEQRMTDSNEAFDIEVGDADALIFEDVDIELVDTGAVNTEANNTEVVRETY